MTLDLGDALTDGASRAVKRNALYLLVVYAIVLLLSTVASHTIAAESIPLYEQFLGRPLTPTERSIIEPATVLAAPISLAAAYALVFVAWIFQETTNVVSDRTFVSDATDALHEPTRRLPLAVVNAMVAVVVIQVLFGVAAVVGILVPPIIGILLLPMVLAVLFFFTRQEIAVQDKNFIDALTDSVQLTKGNRIEVFALGVLLFVLTGVTGWIVGLIPGVAGAVAAAVVAAAFSVFNSAVAAQAYRQLVAENRDGEEQVGALTADDLEEPTTIQQEDSFGTVDFDVGDESSSDDPLDQADPTSGEAPDDEPDEGDEAEDRREADPGDEHEYGDHEDGEHEGSEETAVDQSDADGDDRDPSFR